MSGFSELPQPSRLRGVGVTALERITGHIPRVQVVENSGAVSDSENKSNYISEVKILFEDKRCWEPC